jgi:hypothetical protein
MGGYSCGTISFSQRRDGRREDMGGRRRYFESKRTDKGRKRYGRLASLLLESKEESEFCRFRTISLVDVYALYEFDS